MSSDSEKRNLHSLGLEPQKAASPPVFVQVVRGDTKNLFIDKYRNLKDCSETYWKLISGVGSNKVPILRHCTVRYRRRSEENCSCTWVKNVNMCQLCPLRTLEQKWYGLLHSVRAVNTDFVVRYVNSINLFRSVGSSGRKNIHYSDE